MFVLYLWHVDLNLEVFLVLGEGVVVDSGGQYDLSTEYHEYNESLSFSLLLSLLLKCFNFILIPFFVAAVNLFEL